MDTLTLILMIAAMVCFVIAALGKGVGRINLVALGLACWAATELLPRLNL